jgi:two-component system, OmpR family, sensor histidine kinase CpxA
MGFRLYVCGCTMRPGNLYIKIFLSFVMVLIVTETLIYILFTNAERNIIKYRMEHNTVVKVGMLKDLIDEKARWTKGSDPLDNKEIEELISKMGRIYDADMWISNSNGKPVLKSFSGEVPADASVLDSDEAAHFGEIKIYHNINKTHKVYASVPLKKEYLKGFNLNIIFHEGIQPQQKSAFALGLAIIGLVIALSVIPISRVITERVKELRRSALSIADGDLSGRVKVKARDEIGELGLAFNQMADRLERMISGCRELTANVSHELRTPLTRIRIAEELLREQLERDPSKEFERHLDSIRQDIDELNALIGRILELSKLDMREPKEKNEKINLSGILNEILDRLEPVRIHKNLDLKKELLPDHVTSGDRQSLNTAFLNILDNSLKFSPEHGKIKVRMTCENETLNVYVSNTFEKLPEEDLAKIFEPFYRSHTSNASGSGLGLSIAARIIHKHGGEIAAFNSHEGLEIRVSLPELHITDNL